MKLKFIDFPKPALKQDYEDAVNFIADNLKNSENVISINRFGNITTPGISDVDLLVVFKQDSFCNAKPLLNLPLHQRRLFTHSVDAISDYHFANLFKYSLLPGMQTIYGENKLPPPFFYEQNELAALKKQIALEYLFTNYVDLTVQIHYKTIRLRNFLQHLKGMQYDFEFLNIRPPVLYEMIEELRQWIKDWFTPKQPARNKISGFVESFYIHYTTFLTELLQTHPIYSGNKNAFHLSKNILINPSSSLHHNRKGIILPPSFISGKKYYKLNNKLNTWIFSFPVTFSTSEVILEQRYLYFKELRGFNKLHYPFFHSLTTGIN